MMHGHEKSRSAIVAVKPTNKAEGSAAEPVERRAETKGNADQQRTRRTQRRISVSKLLARIRQHIVAVDTQGGNRMQESCTYGSVRGARGNSRPYRDREIFWQARDRWQRAPTLSFPAPAIAQGIRQLKMVTDWPEDLPGQYPSAVRFAQTIGAATGGRIKIEVFPSGALVRPFEILDAVSAGVADMYHTDEAYFDKKSPAFNFFAVVPF